MNIQPSAIPSAFGGAKLNRAREHFNDLYSAVKGFAQEYSKGSVRFQREDETGDGVLEFPPAEPDERVSWMLGDCVQNLRSALDHAVHELARLRKGDAWSGLGQSEFPIYVQPEAYGKHGRAKIRGIPEPLRAYIERLQFYNRGQEPDATVLDPLREDLYLLNDLSRLDKHRRLHLSRVAVKGANLTILPTGSTAMSIALTSEPQTPILHAARSEAIRIGDLHGEPEVDVHVGARMTVAFKDGPAIGLGVVGIMRRIDSVVETVLAQLSEPPELSGGGHDDPP